MDGPKPNSMTDALMDPMQTVHQVNHATVTLSVIDRLANFDQQLIPDADYGSV